jgi:hypothetical protein
VVVLEQVLAGDVLAEVDVAVVAKARVRRRLLIHAAHRLDLGMVRSHARAYEPPRGGQALEHVDLEQPCRVLEQVSRGVEAGGS